MPYSLSSCVTPYTYSTIMGNISLIAMSLSQKLQDLSIFLYFGFDKKLYSFQRCIVHNYLERTLTFQMIKNVSDILKHSVRCHFRSMHELYSNEVVNSMLTNYSKCIHRLLSLTYALYNMVKEIVGM